MSVVFSSDAEKAIGLAESFATDTACVTDTVHLLIGLCSVKQGYASQILERFSFTEEIARSYWITTTERKSGSPFISPVCEKVLLLSKRIAEDCMQTVCDTQHILLALTATKECTANKILKKYHIEYNDILPIVKTLKNAEEPPEKERPFFSAPQEKNGTEEFGELLSCKKFLFVGREKELERILRILSRKTKNNPLLIGERGVGKTATLFGLAQKIQNGDVPDFLKGKQILLLQPSAVLSGTKYRGDLEERMLRLFQSVREKNQILAIDDLSSVFLTGNGENASIGSLLKPFLEEEIPVIGTCGYDGFLKISEKDSAVERLFTVVKLEEPDEEFTETILKTHQKEQEEHYRVKISPQAIRETVLLCKKYLPDKKFPDKGMDVLEEACGKSTVSEKKTVEQEDIRDIIEEMTGIPTSKLTESEKEMLLSLEKRLSEKIIGQKEATDLVAQVIRRTYAGIRTKKKPIASFLFIGPTGVGKTETAKVLSETLFGKRDAMIRLDMSEYSEKNDVTKLIGSPPAYVGYEEGGKLTEAVRKKPYSVILLDEIEKAHPDIYNTLLQVLDEGRLTDAKGRTVDFANTVIVMTGNIGTKEAAEKEKPLGFGTRADKREKVHAECVTKLFTPEFINRIDEIVVFHKLNKEDLLQISNIIIEGVRKNFREEKNVNVEIDDEVRSYLCEQVDGEYGARPLQKLVEKEIVDKIGEMLILDDLQNDVHICLTNGKPEIIIKEKRTCK